MKVIELYGAPGCGKSTVCKVLQQRIAAKGLSVKTLQELVRAGQIGPAEKLWDVVWAIASDPVFALRAFQFALPYGLTRERVTYTLRLVRLALCLRSIKRQASADVLLLDEGLLQFATSIPHEKPLLDESATNRLCTLIGQKSRGHLICHCMLDSDENTQRLERRETFDSRISKMSSSGKRALIENRRNLFAAMAPKTGLPFLVVDMARPSEQTADAIEQALEKWYER